MIRSFKGQEAIEFVFLAILVFFCSLGAIMVFGGKIANFFNSDSSVAKSAKISSPVYNASTVQKYTDAIDYSAGKGTSSLIGGQIVTRHPDGSVSFSVEGQEVKLSKDVLDKEDIAMETVGAVGTGELIKEIAYMINKYKSEYPDGNVPVDVLFGDGARKYNGSTAENYLGKARINATTIKVGNHFIVIQKDQQCTKKGTGTTCDSAGKYRIEGSADSNSNFTANVTANIKNNDTLSGEFPSGKFNNNSDGSITIDGKFQYNDGGLIRDFDWNFDFTDPEDKYSI